MERKHHHTSAEPRLSRAGFDVKTDVGRSNCNGGDEIETLWRILLRQPRFDSTQGRT
jgi:hypothetical protein